MKSRVRIINPANQSCWIELAAGLQLLNIIKTKLNATICIYLRVNFYSNIFLFIFFQSFFPIKIQICTHCHFFPRSNNKSTRNRRQSTCNPIIIFHKTVRATCKFAPCKCIKYSFCVKAALLSNPSRKDMLGD